MADVSSRGKAVDARAREIKSRRMIHDVHSMAISIEKYEIDILEAHANIDRLKESIVAMQERMEAKQKEANALKGDPENG